MSRHPRIAIVGAGPVGLEAAVAAAEHRLPFTVYEASPEAAAHVRRWGHVRLFSPWEINVSPRVRRRLQRAGQAPPGGGTCPTGHELVQHLLEPVAGLPEVAPHLRLGARVLAVGRQGLLKSEEIGTEARGRRPFRLLLRDPSGGEKVELADVVLDCTGTYGQPNSLGDGGIPAPGETAEEEIHRHLPDFTAEARDWAGRTILLAGAGHSAQTAARDLAQLAREAPDLRVVWALRSDAPGFGTEPDDPLPERARLASVARELASGASPVIETRTGVVVEALSRRNGKIQVKLRCGDRLEPVEVDRILSLTGYVGDHHLYRQLQVHECYATCGPMNLAAALLGSASQDCLSQTSHGADTLKNPEPGFFILGSKSYGRNSTFLMRVGWQQVNEVFMLLGFGESA